MRACLGPTVNAVGAVAGATITITPRCSTSQGASTPSTCGSNANMLVLCQLESTRAFENLDAILEVKGIDAYVFGPNDLAQSMGLPGQPGHPDVVAAQRQVADRIHAAGGKLRADLMAMIELRHLIVDGAQQFLADNA